MPIKKRFSQFVRREPDGSVSLHTPSDCTLWDHEFRLRIVRDYLPPRTLVDRMTYARRFDPKTVYVVQGRKLLFRQPIHEIDDMPSKVLVVRNEVIDVQRKRAFTLKHPEPAMRMLMVYSFVMQTTYAGVALFDTYDWQH